MNKTGQSTIEFALTLVFLVSFIFFFVQLALVFGYGNFVHYATFMAARAELSAGETPDEQLDRARDVLARTLKKDGQPSRDRWPGIARGEGGNGDLPGAQIGNDPMFAPLHQQGVGEEDFSWLQGVRYTFRSRLFMIPLGGSDQSTAITLTSESWLGREPSEQECQDAVKGTLDNGC